MNVKQEKHGWTLKLMPWAQQSVIYNNDRGGWIINITNIKFNNANGEPG